MYLAGSTVNKGDKIVFQYVHGNDRPYIDEIEGVVIDNFFTVGKQQLVNVKVSKCNNNIVSGITHKFFWTNLIVDGSVNIKEKAHVKV